MRSLKFFIHVNYIILFFTTLICCTKHIDVIPPKIDFAQPINNSIIVEDSSFVIELSKYQKDISISKVELYMDNVLTTTMINYPYRYIWQTNHNDIGNHTIKQLLMV